MGKNKQKQKNVFKVAGAKSLKLKAKAKAVKTQLKNINVKTKVEEIDQQLVNLRDEVRSSNSTKEKAATPRTQLPSQKKSKGSQKQTEENLKQLDKMKL